MKLLENKVFDKMKPLKTWYFMKKYILPILIGLLGSTGVNASDRAQIMQAPQAQFQAAMEADFARYMSNMKTAKYYIEPDARSKAIFERIQQQVIKSHPKSKEWNWVLMGDIQNRFNAFGGLYGKVILGSNLFDPLLFSDDELAFVIAHEVVHSLREHAREKYNLNHESDQYIQLSHLVEYEADYMALSLVKDAGYDPKQSLGYLKKVRNFYALLKVEQGGEQATHPSIASRYERLNQLLNE